MTSSISLFEPTSTTPWRAMPGWGIVAELTPTELVNSRQLRVLRRLLAIVLVSLLLMAVGGYVLAHQRNTAAERSLEVAQSQTTQLQSVANGYSGVTRIQGTVSQVEGQIATLMAGDVNLTRLMALMSSSLPPRMMISSELVTLTPGPTTAGAPATTDAVIGSVVLSGTGHTLDDLSTYIDTLKVIAGVADVIPTSNVQNPHGTAFSLTLNLTNALLSHQFDVTTKGTK